MRTEIKKITPELAEKMLMKNTSNRNINNNLVTYYSDQMLRGLWQLNGESIKFSKSGRLLDGQHRLRSILLAGVPVDVFVTYDLNDDVFTTLDTGKSRTAADVMHIMDIPNSTNLASGIVAHYNLLSGKYQSSKQLKLSHQQILDLYNVNQEYWQDLCLKGQRFYKESFRIITQSQFIGLYAAFNKKYDALSIDKFFNDLSLRKEGITELLYNRLMADSMSKSRLKPIVKLALIVKTMNFYLKGENPKQLKFVDGEKFPEIL